MKPITIILGLLLMVSLATATPLGIVSNQYADYDGTIGGSVFQITVRGDNDASYIVFGEQSELETTIDGETVTPESEFSLTQSIESESCEYNLVDTARSDILRYEITKQANDIIFWKVDDYVNECKTSGGVIGWGEQTKFGILGSVQDVYCLKESSRIARVGEVQEGQINFESSFSIKKDNEPAIVKSVSSLSSNEEGIPTNIEFQDSGKTIGRIRWIGGSTYGEFCSGQDNLVAVQDSDNKWFLADKDKFTRYDVALTELNQRINNVLSTNKIDDFEVARIRELSTNVNNFGTQTMIPSKINIEGSTSTISGSKAIVQLPRDHLIYAPDFQIILSTDWLGIVYQTSKPEIIEAGFNSCDESSTTNSVYATIENIGNKQATFDVSLACQEGLSVATTQRSIKLNPGATGTVTLPFSIDLTNDGKKTCVVTAADSLNIDNKDKQSVSTTCQASVFCNPEGKTDCFGTIEKICSSTGQWEETGTNNCDTTICDRDGICDKNEGESFELCGGKLASDNDCATCNLDGQCGSTENSYTCPSDCGTIKTPISKVWLILGGIILAAATFFGINSIKPKGKGKKKPVRRKRK